MMTNDIDTLYTTRMLDTKDRLSQRREEIYDKIPQIAQIDSQIQQTGVFLTRLALGKDDATDIEQKCARLSEENSHLVTQKHQLLVQNGYPEDYLEDGIYFCKQCRDTGRMEGRKCDCYKQQVRQAAYRESNLAPLLDTQNFTTFRLDYYSDTPNTAEGKSPRQHMLGVYNTCLEFAESFPGNNTKGLLMYGKTGTGKTFLSSAIAKKLLDGGYDVVYQSAAGFFRSLSDAHFGNEKTNDLMRYFDCDLLILDDLGTEFATNYTKSVLFDLINTRDIRGKKTIINSNLSLQEISAMYSARVTSRLTQYVLIKFFGEDLRIAQKQQ